MQANRNLTKLLTQQCPAKCVAFSQIASGWGKRRPEQGVRTALGGALGRRHDYP